MTIYQQIKEINQDQKELTAKILVSKNHKEQTKILSDIMDNERKIKQLEQEQRYKLTTRVSVSGMRERNLINKLSTFTKT